MGHHSYRGNHHAMFEAISIAAMLAGLWSLLILVGLLRTRAPVSERSATPVSFPHYRRQRDLCNRLIALTVCLPLVSLSTAAISNQPLAMLPGAVFGLYLFLGCGYVHRVLDRLPSSGPNDEPALHGLSLALCWPFWAVGRSNHPD